MGMGRGARVSDIGEIAAGMPHAQLYDESADRPIWQVGGKSFVFGRSPRPDAVDPATGELAARRRAWLASLD